MNDFFGVPWPIRFQGVDHHLRWLGTPAIDWLPDHGPAPLQRYLPLGQEPQRCDRAVHLTLIRRTPIEVHDAIARSVQQRSAAGDPIAGHASRRHPHRPDDDLCIDHLAASADGQTVQWCAERAVRYTPEERPEAAMTTLLSVFRYASGAEITPFMQRLRDHELSASVDELTSMPMPSIAPPPPNQAPTGPVPDDASAALGVPVTVRFDDVDHHLCWAGDEPVPWLPGHPPAPDHHYVADGEDPQRALRICGIQLFDVPPHKVLAARERSLSERKSRDPICDWQVWHRPAHPDDVTIDYLVSSADGSTVEWTAVRNVSLPGGGTASYRVMRRGYRENARVLLLGLPAERGRVVTALLGWDLPPVRRPGSFDH